MTRSIYSNVSEPVQKSRVESRECVEALFVDPNKKEKLKKNYRWRRTPFNSISSISISMKTL